MVSLRQYGLRYRRMRRMIFTVASIPIGAND